MPTPNAIPSTGGHVDFSVLLEVGDPADLVGTMLYGTGLYDTNTYGTNRTAYMADVTEFVEGIPTIRRGRQKYTGRFRTGNCTIDLDNTDGIWTPNAGDPAPGLLTLRPGRLVSVFAIIDDGTPIQIFAGKVDTFTDTYGPDGNLVTRIKGLDVFGDMVLNDLPAVPAEGGGETSDVRVQRILTHFFDPSPELVLLGFELGPEASSDGTTMLATTLAQSALQEVQITADSEGGAIWVAPDGVVIFTQFDYLADLAAGFPKWAAGQPGQRQVVKIGTADWSASRIINEAHIQRVGGVEQVVVNTDSIDKYERRTHTRRDLETDDDGRANEIAQRLVTNLANDRAQITSMTLQPSTTAEAVMGATAEIGDVVLLSVRTIHGWSYTVKTQIFGVTHSVSASVWRVDFLLDDTEIEVRGAFSSGFSDGFDV